MCVAHAHHQLPRLLSALLLTNLGRASLTTPCTMPCSFGVLLIELLTLRLSSLRGDLRLPHAPQECPTVRAMAGGMHARRAGGGNGASFTVESSDGNAIHKFQSNEVSSSSMMRRHAPTHAPPAGKAAAAVAPAVSAHQLVALPGGSASS